ncbi:MAG: hypothetical protein NT028_10495 [candidate division Zixibacteria bacterium]|nr:hypothetical protein [candidate division Zixibacteria bacterium]
MTGSVLLQLLIVVLLGAAIVLFWLARGHMVGQLPTGRGRYRPIWRLRPYFDAVGFRQMMTGWLLMGGSVVVSVVLLLTK